MLDTHVTMAGWVGGPVDLRAVGDTVCASFRIGCTPRQRTRDGVWKDGETSWYTVNCWRTLGENVAASINKGDAVVVHGRLRTDIWRREGQPDSVTHYVEAAAVGHDLSKGTAQFHRVRRIVDPGEAIEVKEMLHGHDSSGPQLDREGDDRPAEETPAAAEPAAVAVPF